MRQHIIISLTALLLSACASPPPPAPVPWDTPGRVVNATLPQWQENSTIIPSASPAGHWSVVIRAFSPQDTGRTPGEYYAVAHATRIVVESSVSVDWFRAKGWLRQHGVQGVIGWQPALNGLACNETRIYLSR
ncbi:cag pathogenicity island Cag12 family protein [Citrobacter amalonaticus]|uniref:cag pathogenicity island Cag12 family protein n=1 Tax=Citrobacter amalonaticus TaxID=35703 RepID=UPI001A2A5D14|nr:Cag pathogenicity island protein Cag12 [Citrobacter amalonaticus]HDQ2811400.1 Cag pathogenicity island protein Cag12 [Citrobacter amalonaticus]